MINWVPVTRTSLISLTIFTLSVAPASSRTSYLREEFPESGYRIIEKDPSCAHVLNRTTKDPGTGAPQ